MCGPRAPEEVLEEGVRVPRRRIGFWYRFAAVLCKPPLVVLIKRDWRGMENFSKREFETIMDIDREAWKVELLAHAELFERMYDKLPKEYIFMRELLLSGLWRSPAVWQLEPETV